MSGIKLHPRFIPAQRADIAYDELVNNLASAHDADLVAVTRVLCEHLQELLKLLSSTTPADTETKLSLDYYLLCAHYVDTHRPTVAEFVKSVSNVIGRLMNTAISLERGID